jgi:TolB-like protein
MSLDKNETAIAGCRLVHEPSELEIRTELQAVLSSLTFREQERPRRMLSYLVDECLAGRSSGLKAYTIAVDVFGRGPNFDQSTDAVVRVHASRLRGMLTQHYSGDGHMCRVRIGLPKGSYIPTFTFAGLDDQTTLTKPDAPQIGVGETTESQSPALSLPRGWLDNRFRLLGLLSLLLALFGFGLSTVAPREPQTDVAAINSIGLVPIWTSSESPELSDYAAQLGKELLRTISTSQYISLKRAESLDSPIPSSTALKAVARSLDVRWLLFGTLAMEQPGGRRVVMSIVDGLSGRFVWSTAYDEPVPHQSSSERADAIIADIRPVFLALSRRALEIAGSAHYSPLEHFFLSTWTSGTGTNRLDWELERVAIARAALNAEPRFGPAHAVLSDKLAYLANVDFPSDTDNNRLEARMHGKRCAAPTCHCALKSSMIPLHGTRSI